MRMTSWTITNVPVLLNPSLSLPDCFIGLLIINPHEICVMIHNLYFLYNLIIDPLLTIDCCSVTISRFNDPMVTCSYLSIYRLNVIHEYSYEKTNYGWSGCSRVSIWCCLRCLLKVSRSPDCMPFLVVAQTRVPVPGMLNTEFRSLPCLGFLFGEKKKFSESSSELSDANLIRSLRVPRYGPPKDFK